MTNSALALKEAFDKGMAHGCYTPTTPYISPDYRRLPQEHPLVVAYWEGFKKAVSRD